MPTFVSIEKYSIMVNSMDFGIKNSVFDLSFTIE